MNMSMAKFDSLKELNQPIPSWQNATKKFSWFDFLYNMDTVLQ